MIGGNQMDDYWSMMIITMMIIIMMIIIMMIINVDQWYITNDN